MYKQDNVQTMKVIDLVHIIRAEGEEPGQDSPIWVDVSRSRHGNQVFNNDSLFIYVLPSVNGEDLSPIQKRIADICKHAINDDHTIVFSVSW